MLPPAVDARTGLGTVASLSPVLMLLLLRPADAPAASVDAASTTSSPSTPPDAPTDAITLTDAARTHILKMRAEAGGDALLLRVGVRAGGCSGMSYVMDFENAANVGEDDYVISYPEGFRLACDSKSLLYLFGLELDYSSELIGGGFRFSNPNAVDSCGCGKRCVCVMTRSMVSLYPLYAAAE